jgi:hypothetical protein
MAKVPVVACMLVTSQNDAANGADVYVFHHETNDDLRSIAEAHEHGTLSPKQARRRLLKYLEVIDVPDIDSNGTFGSHFASMTMDFSPRLKPSNMKLPHWPVQACPMCMAPTSTAITFNRSKCVMSSLSSNCSGG